MKGEARNQGGFIFFIFFIMSQDSYNPHQVAWTLWRMRIKPSKAFCLWLSKKASILPWCVRAKSHYVKFGLTRLRFSKFPWQRKKNGENAASNALSSTQRRGLRWRRCVCFFCVFCRLMTSTTVRWLIFRGKRSMSNHSHRREISVGDKVLSLSTEIVHLASRVSLLTLGIQFLLSSRQPSR